MQKAYYRVLCSIYLVALLLCVGLQTFLRLYHIDARTGLYTAGGGAPAALTLTLTVSVSVWFLMTLLRRTRNEFPVYRYGRLPRMLGMLAGFSILADTAHTAMRQLPAIGQATSYDRFFVLSTLLFGAFGCLAMVWFALRSRSGRGDALGVFPALWQLIALLGRYKRVPTLPGMSENLFLILFMCFSTIFLLGQARTLCAYSPPNGRSYVIPSGFAASLFGFVLVIPAAAARLAGRAPTILVDLTATYWIAICAISLYAVFFLLDYIRSIKSV